MLYFSTKTRAVIHPLMTAIAIGYSANIMANETEVHETDRNHAYSHYEITVDPTTGNFIPNRSKRDTHQINQIEINQIVKKGHPSNQDQKSQKNQKSTPNNTDNTDKDDKGHPYPRLAPNNVTTLPGGGRMVDLKGQFRAQFSAIRSDSTTRNSNNHTYTTHCRLHSSHNNNHNHNHNHNHNNPTDVPPPAEDHRAH